MTTAATVINMALRDAGVLATGETANSDMMSDAFATLQQMLDMWQIDGLYVYGTVDNLFAPTGATSYTVGVGGTANFVQPPSVDYAYWSYGGIDYPIEQINTYEEYAELALKTQTGQPEYLYFENGATFGQLFLYPQPSSGSVHLVSKIQLPALTASTDTLTLPPEYIMPIRFSLRELFCSMWNMPITPDIPLLAKRYRTMLKRGNVRIPEMGMPATIPTNTRSNIFKG